MLDPLPIIKFLELRACSLRIKGHHAQNCDLDRELKSTIIQNCLSKRLRRIALREDLSLDNLLAKARSVEASETQASEMEQSFATANRVQLKKPQRRTFQKPACTQIPSAKHCRNCGLTWPHKKGLCPAQGKICKKCRKLPTLLMFVFQKQQ